MAEKIRFPQIPSTVWWGVRSILQKTPNVTVDERLLSVQLGVQEAAARAYVNELRSVGPPDMNTLTIDNSETSVVDSQGMGHHAGAAVQVVGDRGPRESRCDDDPKGVDIAHGVAGGIERRREGYQRPDMESTRRVLRDRPGGSAAQQRKQLRQPIGPLKTKRPRLAERQAGPPARSSWARRDSRRATSCSRAEKPGPADMGQRQAYGQGVQECY